MTRAAYCFARAFAPEPSRELCVDRHYLLCASTGALRLEAHGQAWLLPPARAALIEAGRQPQPTTVTDVELKARLDSLNSLKARLEKDMNSAQHVLGSAPGDFIGYVLTMLAISLGAPFWFDLLNKLISLRSSKRPAEPVSVTVGNRSVDVTNEVLNRVG